MTTEDRSTLEHRFNRALALRDTGDWEGARMELEELATAFPNHPGVLGMLGSIYFHLGDDAHSLVWYEKSARLSPKSELASLGLFHSLWNTGQQAAAMDEMNRFLAIATSDEYTQLSRELALADVPTSESDPTHTPPN